MTIAEWCVFGTLMLYMLTIGPVKWIGIRQFDNSRPRDPAFYDDPLRARALGAHQNGIEAFPFFAVAVLLAEFRTGPQRLPDRALRGAGDDRQAALARVHALGPDRAPALVGQVREAEIAEQAPAIELMDALAREGRAAAVGARRVRLGEGADAAADEHCGKFGHRKVFGAGPRNPLDPDAYAVYELGKRVAPKRKKARN